MNRHFERLWQALTEGAQEDEAALPESVSLPPRPLPVIWLLGKTGAGKSSLIHYLTGLSAAAIGNGFKPCTRRTMELDFPEGLPLMRFLDTRGLGEAGYDPAEDLAECERASHVVLALARLDDPVQGELAHALGAVHRRRPATRIIAVHTGADLIADEEARFRARSATQRVLEKAVGETLPWVELALPAAPKETYARGLGTLVALLEDTMPEVALLLEREELRNTERARFADIRAEVLRYAAAAAAADLAPVVGAVSVPSIQAAMLRKLAQRYDVEWSRARLAEFAVALGLGAALRYGGGYAARQAAKLIPVYGQTAGAAAAGGLSFAATFALGRAAAYYLHRVRLGEAVPSEELRQVYREALRRTRHDGS